MNKQALASIKGIKNTDGFFMHSDNFDPSLGNAVRYSARKGSLARQGWGSLIKERI